MEGLLLLREKLGAERRPLSWVAGPQGVTRPDPTCMRDLKRQERAAATILPSPDDVK
jgi:NADH-quinone oxidoreductase subunit B